MQTVGVKLFRLQGPNWPTKLSKLSVPSISKDVLGSGARVVNVSSSAGFLIRIQDPGLKQKFANENLSYEELDGLMNDFIESAQNGNHSAKGWPNSTYVVSKIGLSAMSRMQQR